ncbi:MAG: FecR domain-containing protein [Balneolaceae bacterium]
MSNQNNIPDKDRKLARKIGNWLDNDVSLSKTDDPDVELLLKYKKNREEKSGSSNAKKEAVWEKIQSEIRPVKYPTPFIKPSYRKAFLAIAASLLVAILGTLFILQQTDDLEVIAQSDSNLETIILEDNSEVTLRPHSTLYRQYENSGSTLYKLEGEGYFVIVKNPDRIFSVEAGNGTVEVLGTRFNLREWGNQTEVFLEEGKIQVSLTDRSNNVILTPGQKTIISPDRQITRPIEVSAEEVTGWIKQELVFHNRKTEMIFKELEYHFNIQITAPQHILDEHLGGAVSLAELGQCLNDLEAVLNGEFVATGTDQYQFISKK